MSGQIKDGGSAFPVTFIDGPTGQPCAIAGMTLRDYFAAKAIPVAHVVMVRTHGSTEAIGLVGEMAYHIADLMLAAREVKA